MRTRTYHQQDRCYHPNTGRSKLCYRSKAKADRARIEMLNRGMPRVYPYLCRHCGEWHVSKEQPRG